VNDAWMEPTTTIRTTSRVLDLDEVGLAARHVLALEAVVALDGLHHDLVDTHARAEIVQLLHHHLHRDVLRGRIAVSCERERERNAA